jgi:hypothetical protein
MLKTIIRRLKSENRGISNVLVVMLSLILITVIVANVVLWNYQMNQLDIERMHESVKITEASRLTRSAWSTARNEFTIIKGNITSGSYAYTRAIDGFYETFMEETETVQRYSYPSSYNLIGGTSLVSGSPRDLQTNNGVYMLFGSYTAGSEDFVDQLSDVDNFQDIGTHSNFDYMKAGPDSLYDMLTEQKVISEAASSKTNALIAYRSNTGTNMLSSPKNRIWTGDAASWSGEIEMPNAGSPVRWVRTEYCPVQSRGYEVIVVTLSDDGYLDAYVWNGVSWIVTNNIAYTGTTANTYRCFDIAYEHASGRALLVYSRGTTTNEIGYRIWDGNSWSPEALLDLPYTSGIVYWIVLASCPGTRSGTADDNEIAMIYIDSNVDVYGYVWTSSAWNDMGQTAVWDATAAIATEECIAVAYEQLSGRAMFIWGDATPTDNYYRIWDGTTLSGPALLDIPAQGSVTNWVVLKADPNSNGLLFGVLDNAFDLNTAYWNGSAWTVHGEHDAAVDTHASRCFDFAWNPVGSTGLLVWGTTSNSISWKTFTPPNTWSVASTAPAAGTHRWIQLRTNSRYVSGDKYVLGADLNSNLDIGSITWDGTTFTITEGAITTDTTSLTYECFEIAFMKFGPVTINYQLDLEAQWVNAEYDGENKYLCIQTGMLSPENLRVDVWNGSSWVTVISALLPNQWNNISVSSYLTSNTFTIRFVDETKTGDTVQSSWQIDCALLYMEKSYVQVEFMGTSITQDWMQIVWTVDCSSTVGSVNTTLQLYDYDANGYPTSGDGYITTIIGTEDVTTNQTITFNPSRFKDANGNWKMKIVGKGATSFNFKIDLIELMIVSNIYRLKILNIFTIALSEYPLDYVYGLEIMVRYNVSEVSERWFIKAYDWSSGSFSDADFNFTEGSQPAANEWNNYAVSVNMNWTRYMSGNGTIQIMFCDEGISGGQTFVYIDFIGVRAILNGIRLDIKNSGATTVHIVALWVINVTYHRRYDADFFINPGEIDTYIRLDITLPAGNFTVKIVTERGNMDSF